MIRLVVLCLFASQAWGATILTESCSRTDVNTAINASSNGDTVNIKAGSCTWVTGIATSKQITLQGEAPDAVTITHNAGTGTLLAFTTGSSNRTVIANLNFMPGIPENTGGNYISIQEGDSPLVPIMHHMKFNIPNFQLAHAVLWHVTGGLIHNTVFESTDTGDCASSPGSGSGSLVIKSQKSWYDASTMGTLDTDGLSNLYIEDSIFSNVGQAPDVDDNGRVAMRHVRFIGSSGVSHGTTSSSGGRQVEIYDSSFEFPDQDRDMGNSWFWMRGGTLLVTGNSIEAYATGACHGTRPSFMFVVENAQRGPDGHNCCTGYMCYHQPGSGAGGIGSGPHTPGMHASQIPFSNAQKSDPVYIWNNTGTGQTSLLITSWEEGSPSSGCGTTWSTGDFFQEDRDYFVDTSSSPTSGAKPGWTRYPYPHPLRNTGQTQVTC